MLDRAPLPVHRNAKVWRQQKMCRFLNKHHARIPAGAIYIGRGSKWGNPFRDRRRPRGCHR
jgi:Domain of unknown function (DUF4326)